MIERLVDGKFESIPQLFNFFHRYPDSEPDNADRIAELLAWTGRQEDLFVFAKPLVTHVWQDMGPSGARNFQLHRVWCFLKA
jgi:hypothetical protein